MRTSEKPFCHISHSNPRSFFARNEKFSFDQLDRLLNRHTGWDRQQDVNMITHHDKLVDFELSLSCITSEHLDKQAGHSLGLQQRAASGGCGRDEICSGA